MPTMRKATFIFCRNKLTKRIVGAPVMISVKSEWEK